VRGRVERDSRFVGRIMRGVGIVERDSRFVGRKVRGRTIGG